MRFVLLALIGGLLVAFGGTPTATAAVVVPCTRTFTGKAFAVAPETTPGTAPAYTWSRDTITVPAGGNLEDVDVTVRATHPDAANLQISIVRTPGFQHILVPRLPSIGANVSPLTFDDEAAGVYVATSPAGTYKPRDAFSSLDGLPVAGAWTIQLANWDSRAGSVAGWSIEIDYATCDGDGDGVEEHADNCAGLANPDQVDLDGDGIGNECDDDLDGDGAVNNADNCLTLANADQADADGDGSGDPCDGDRDGDGTGGADNCPTVANADQADTDADSVGDVCDLDDDADGRPDATDRCPRLGAPAASGCPPVDRTLKLKQKKRVLTGLLSSDVAACQGGKSVSVWQARRGKDKRIGEARSGTAGRFTTKLGRRTGKFYAKVSGNVAAGVADCSAAKSRKVTVRHR